MGAHLKYRNSFPTDFRFTVNSILQSISCVFLLLTLLIYICLPVLQNLHGKTVMCHSASLLLAYTCLAIVPWVTPNRGPEDNYETTFCAALGTFLFHCYTLAATDHKTSNHFIEQFDPYKNLFRKE